MKVTPLRRPDEPWAMDAITRLWGGEPLVSASGMHKVADLGGLGAFDGEKPLGFLHYLIDGDALEVVTIVSLGNVPGIGKALMAAAEGTARANDCSKLWLLTTSDNPGAIAFYQRLGLIETRRIKNFSDEVRKLKPEAAGTYDAVMFEKDVRPLNQT